MSWLLYFISGIIGAVIAWLWAKARLEARAKASEAVTSELRQQVTSKEAELTNIRSELDAERQLKADTLARLDESRKNIEEQKNLIEAMKTELSDTFNALSSAALKSSSEDFLRLAGEHLGKVIADTDGKLGKHHTAMDGIIKPLQDALKKYEEQIHSIEVKRKQDYTSLDEHIKMLSEAHRDLQRETGNLVTALRKPHIRGRWGEVTLRNVVELAGMSSHCDFTEQVSVETEVETEAGETKAKLLRPDMVIHMPGGHDIVVDSKVPLDALLDVASAQTETAKEEALKRHGKHVNNRINDLRSKAYWKQFEKSPELAVLFLPESALVAALEIDRTLIEDSMSVKVLIATPTTLFALLTAVAYGWRKEQVTRESEAIAALGKELYERVSVWAGHVNDIGRALGNAVDAYNKSVGSIESRVLPSVRKFKELGATSAAEIAELQKADKMPRNLSLIE